MLMLCFIERKGQTIGKEKYREEMTNKRGSEVMMDEKRGGEREERG